MSIVLLKSHRQSTSTFTTETAKQAALDSIVPFSSLSLRHPKGKTADTDVGVSPSRSMFRLPCSAAFSGRRVSSTVQIARAHQISRTRTLWAGRTTMLSSGRPAIVEAAACSATLMSFPVAAVPTPKLPNSIQPASKADFGRALPLAVLTFRAGPGPLFCSGTNCLWACSSAAGGGWCPLADMKTLDFPTGPISANGSTAEERHATMPKRVGSSGTIVQCRSILQPGMPIRVGMP
ncbi:hypothetical protein N658DRAFT_60861 [Parathielavia hyrcaniae]|uniref:Uncharacterized protein n=1 Tax=Parathielavia hyrcaniae TaxID=113614 RepID=A0AAN6T1L7_9PEZI|nr:hypothetical protein N658DRAFT_60861 [Parathielavia hyrcaniae]